MDRVHTDSFAELPSQDGRDLLDAGHGPQLAQQVAIGQRDDPSSISLNLPSTFVDYRSQFKIFPDQRSHFLVAPI